MKMSLAATYSRAVLADAQVLSSIGGPPAGATMLTVRSPPWQADWSVRLPEALAVEVKSICPLASAPAAPARAFAAGMARARRSRSVGLSVARETWLDPVRGPSSTFTPVREASTRPAQSAQSAASTRRFDPQKTRFASLPGLSPSRAGKRNLATKRLILTAALIEDRAVQLAKLNID